MSFWPFSNALNNNNQLHKFLDSVQDFSQVSVDDVIGNPSLLQEVLNELHHLKSSYSNNTSFQYLQQQQAHDNTQPNGSSNSDTFSLTSSTNENTTAHGKDTQGAKLLELLLQPHILNGFLDYIVSSVDFFHDLSVKESQDLIKLVQSKDEDNGKSTSDEADVEVEQDEDPEATMDSKDKEDEETHEEILRRCIQASSDILSIDIWVILNRIIETSVIISKLWSILSLPNLLENSLSVSYLVHILDQLMDKNSIELLNFIRRQPDLVDTFLNKIEIPMLMDFLLRVIQTDKAVSPTGIVEVLSLQQLIPKLIGILKPDPSQFAPNSQAIPNHELFFIQTAAADFIKALVTISSNTALAVVLETNIGPNQLTRELVSPKIIKTMINDIMLYKPPDGLFETNKHGINNCVGIIIELIRKNNSDYDLNCGPYSPMLQNNSGENAVGEVNSFVMFQWLKDFEQNPPSPRDPIYLGEMLSIFSDHLHDFSDLMKIIPIAPAHVDNSKILGFTKFKVAELIAELLHCSNMILLNSRKIRKVVRIRDNLRLQRSKRLKNALNEALDSHVRPEKNNLINDVTSGLDDVSLDDINFVDGSSTSDIRKDEFEIDLPDDSRNLQGDNNDSSLTDILDSDDSEDDEPKISLENPFVCKERDSTIRSNPCIGDAFKIKLADLGILHDIISKFTEYPWHNFFHNVVFDLIQQIFNGKLNSYNSFLIVDLFKPDKCSLTELIMDSYRENPEPRPGYMGHLILISEEVVKFTSLYKPDLISSIIVNAISSQNWDWFVNEILLKTREVYNVVLGAEQDDEDESMRLTNKDQESYGFDSSTVGYLDIDSYDNGQSYPKNKNSIILGDRSNHDLFVNDQRHLNVLHEGHDDEEHMEETQVPDVRIQDSPPVEDPNHREGLDFFDNDEFHDEYHDSEFLDNLSGSSSSDDEDEDEGGNVLRRVPKHNE